VVTSSGDRGSVTIPSRPDARGQAHALEGIVAALVVLSAVVFALEMTAVTPLSASTSSQHIENQQEATARGVLGTAAESGALKETVLFWNTTGSGRFWDANRTSESYYYTSGPPPTEFGEMLNRSFDRRGIAYNVNLRYDGSDGPRTTTQLVYQGVPSDNAVRATWPVVLYRNDKLVNRTGTPRNVSNVSSSFYAPQASSSSVYNVIRVEVVVWRI